MYSDLQTPAVLVDRERLSRNIARAQARANAAKVSLRPHVKTHRSVEIAQRQLRAGAVGITCAKPSEAEVFVAAGFQDVRVAYPIVGPHRLHRLIDLANRARVTFCVDSVEAASEAAGAFTEAGGIARVLVKIDCGYGRAGWRWDEPSLAQAAHHLGDLEGLEVIGVLTHAGQAYVPGGAGSTPAETLAGHACNERDRTQQAADVVARALGRCAGELEVSVGSTPTFWSFAPSAEERFRVTELRPGNYVFHDLTQVDLGAADLDDCALTVVATVVSVRERNGRVHALIDAGKKTFTSDQRAGQDGYGLVLNQPELHRTGRQLARRDWRLHALSEEHGWLDLPSNAEVGIGDRLRVVVNHACVVASTQSRLVEVSGNEVVGSFEVNARGCSL